MPAAFRGYVLYYWAKLPAQRMQCKWTSYCLYYEAQLLDGCSVEYCTVQWVRLYWAAVLVRDRRDATLIHGVRVPALTCYVEVLNCLSIIIPHSEKKHKCSLLQFMLGCLAFFCQKKRAMRVIVGDWWKWVTITWTYKRRCGHFLVNEWQRISPCRTKAQLFILSILGDKGRSSTIVWLPTSVFSFFLSQQFTQCPDKLFSCWPIWLFKG